MPQLSDKDMMQIILDKHKHCAVKLIQLAMECSDFGLRNEVLKTLDMCLKHQHHTYELMRQLGWYQTTPASPDEIRGLKNLINQQAMA